MASRTRSVTEVRWKLAHQSNGLTDTSRCHGGEVGRVFHLPDTVLLSFHASILEQSRALQTEHCHYCSCPIIV